jgi:acetyl esterase/lipase
MEHRSGVLGADWNDRMPSRLRRQMVHRRWTGPIVKSPQPRLRQDVPFATVPGTGRVLLCDVWQPPIGVAPSGVAVVYLHGSAYVVFDKDFATRPLFRHLVAQGHVIVDVAYRLYPKTDVPGMVADALRAVAWVRDHAGELGVDPDRIVLAGGSAGGHLSLLAAYGHDAPAFQMGWDRGGWYSWDRIDNAGRPSATEVHPEWQDLTVGDQLRAWSPGGPLASRSSTPHSSGRRPATWSRTRKPACSSSIPRTPRVTSRSVVTPS